MLIVFTALILLFSKSLLRHPLTRSSTSDLIESNGFQEVLADTDTKLKPDAIERILLCSGQVYAALQAYRQANKVEDTAIVRIEQLHPFPFDALLENIEHYPNAKEILWVQEEPYNGGAWQYIRDRLDSVLALSKSDRKFRCVSRPISAATAVGSKKVSDHELETLLKKCFNRN